MRIRFLFISLLIFGVSIARAEESNCPALLSKNVAIERLVTSKYVSGQEHPYLERKGYLPADGGLCGPTSACILLTALDQRTGVDSEATPQEIQRLTDLAARIGRSDARMGLDTRVLTELVAKEATERGHEIEIKAVSVEEGTGINVIRAFNSSFFESQPEDAVFILTTKVYSIRRQKPVFVWYHFSIAYAFDVHTMTLKVVDPLHPKKIRTARLIPTELLETGAPTFELQFDAEVPGYPAHPLVHLTEVQTVTD